MAGNRYLFSLLYRPGLSMKEEARESLVHEFREVAETCFATIPEYQCLLGTKEELSDKIIMVARTESGRMVGFCSSMLIPVPGVGTVVHLGLTCVRPEARGSGLTHLLASRLLSRYLLRYSPFGRVWISNVACVLSSLGNIALNFEGVFPSPYGLAAPTEAHRAIASKIDASYRFKAAINESAKFDRRTFVFRGSVVGTPFQKDADDHRFHHRREELNAFYGELLHFDEGDEVLQVGYFSALTAVKYFGLRFLYRYVPSLQPRPISIAALTSSGAVPDQK